MIKVRNLETQQKNLVSLIQFADSNGYLRDDVHTPFVELFTKAFDGPLTRSELTELTIESQRNVCLPVYTTTQAAAWLGVGIDTVRDAIWRNNPPKLVYLKPGHDILIPDSSLWMYLANNGD